jgi:hypothetical protein
MRLGQSDKGGVKIEIRKLPPEIVELLGKLGASQRLIAHLALVHDVAIRIMREVDQLWPCLKYDRQAVIIGAATHDIGKTIHADELSDSGNQHETIGPGLLIQHGIPEIYARFALTDGQWEQSTGIENLLVALADKIWKGTRNKDLEMKIARQVSSVCAEEVWSVYIKLDDILSPIAKDADERLAWCRKHSL